MKICIIGGGNMGLTYAESFTRSGLITESRLLIIETNSKQQQVIDNKNYTWQPDLTEKVDEYDVVILAIKPQHCRPVLERLSNLLTSRKYILSIMAGISLAFMESYLKNHLLFRAMPNLPAKNGLGMTVFTTKPGYTGEQLFVMHNLLNTTGKALYVENERLIDAATAVSGSGPAYVFYFMQSMIEEAMALGFNTSEADLLVKQTFLGAVQLYINSGLSCEEWMNKVASKGGTTEAAFDYFAANRVKEKIQQGVARAFERAVELGEE